MFIGTLICSKLWRHHYFRAVLPPVDTKQKHMLTYLLICPGPQDNLLKEIQKHTKIKIDCTGVTLP